MVQNMDTISITINGTIHSLPALPGEMLSDLLRDRLRLTGTKIGCDEAECGACTVLVDGEPGLSCIYPAERADGKDILTIEGLATPLSPSVAGIQPEKRLHALQAAFVAHG